MTATTIPLERLRRLAGPIDSDALSQAVGRALDELCAVRATLCAARADIKSRHTSISRDVSRHAEQAIDHLREIDESLKEVVNDLMRRD